MRSYAVNQMKLHVGQKAELDGADLDFWVVQLKEGDRWLVFTLKCSYPCLVMFFTLDKHY